MSFTTDSLKAKGYVETAPGHWEIPKFLPPTGQPEVVHAPVDHERDLHDQIEAHCLSNGWLYIHSRMDKPSTIQVGTPDFIIFEPMAITTFIECKARNGKTTTKQLEKLAHAKKLGYTAEAVDNFESFLEVMRNR